jgi:trans-aconitate methyltransferase
VAALAVALAEAFPRAEILGIDVMDRVLEPARRELAAADPAAGRVTVRRQDVAELREPAAFDLVRLPAPFLSEAALGAALPRLTEALRPGGLIVAGTNPPAGDPLVLASPGGRRCSTAATATTRIG